MHRAVKLIALPFAGVLFIAIVVVAYFLFSPLPSLPQLTGQGKSVTVRVGERERSVLEYVPAKLPSGSPLVIVLHGSFMTGELMRRMTGFEFDALADKNNFAVFYPDAYKMNWNDCRIAGRFAARLENIDDLGFMRALIAEAKAKYGNDTGHAVPEPCCWNRNLCIEYVDSRQLALPARHAHASGDDRRRDG
jgi:polyhydroxybutyrate depolymerase